MKRIFILVKFFSFIWFFTFIFLGVYFAIYPARFTGVEISLGSAFWHSLSLGYMAVISVLALFPAINPRKYWVYLLPLSIAKLSSSCVFFYWYRTFGGETLLQGSLIDLCIGVVALILYLYLYKKM